MGMMMPGMMMPGMMPGYGMPPGMMPMMDNEEPDFLIDLIGEDEDGDGFDAYDELITDHVDSDPDDKPTQAEVDAAYEKYEELGWNALEENWLEPSTKIPKIPHTPPIRTRSIPCLDWMSPVPIPRT